MKKARDRGSWQAKPIGEKAKVVLKNVNEKYNQAHPYIQKTGQVAERMGYNLGRGFGAIHADFTDVQPRRQRAPGRRKRRVQAPRVAFTQMPVWSTPLVLPAPNKTKSPTKRRVKQRSGFSDIA